MKNFGPLLALIGLHEEEKEIKYQKGECKMRANCQKFDADASSSHRQELAVIQYKICSCKMMKIIGMMPKKEGKSFQSTLS